MTTLNGTWTLSGRDLDHVGTLPEPAHLRVHGDVAVPGHVQQQLGLAEPFLDTPEVVAVNDSEWIYERTVAAPGAGRHFLVFAGTDYYCDVWVNGVHVGHHAGMYSDWEVEITDAIGDAAEVVIQVAVSCPWRILENAQPLLPATFEASLDANTEYLKGNHIMQWDGWPMRGMTLLPFGLWRDVELVTRTAPTLRRAAVATASFDADTAHLTLSGEWWSGEADPVELQLDLEIAPENFEGAPVTVPVTVTVQPGYSDVDVAFTIDEPHLWWTWDLGVPNLYRASLAGTDAVFGIRTFHRSADTLESHLNGHRIFLRGVWNSPTTFEGSVTPAGVRRDIEFLRDSNGNSLNVHGYVARPELYDAADQLGVLLFQQLPFHQFGPGDLVAPDNPRSAEFVPHILGEFESIIRRIRGAASLVIWGSFAEARQNGEWWFGDYDAIDASIAELVRALDTDAEYHSSYCDFGETHYWHGAIAFGEYTDNLEADTHFVSEFGCPAPPVLESLETFVSPESLWGYEPGRTGRLGLPIDPAEWAYIWGHDYEGMTASLERVLHHVSPYPETIDEFVDATGWYQWLAHRYNGEIYRRKRYANIAGIRMWSLRDSSPGAKCAPLDYWQRPKMGLEGLRLAYRPFLLSLDEPYPLEPKVAGEVYRRDVHVINDTAGTHSGTLTATLLDAHGTPVAPVVTSAYRVAPDDSVRIPVAIELPAEPGAYLLRLESDESPDARSDNWVVTVPPAFDGPLEVLLLGQTRYTDPVRHALRRVGGLELTVLDETNRDPKDASWTADLGSYDVIWLTGWERAVHTFTRAELQAIADAVRGGVGFVHSGGQGSFHAGDSMGAQLDATPLGDILPVELRRNDLIWDLPPAIVDAGANAALGIDLTKLPSHGFARTTLRAGSTELATAAGYPLLVEGRAGEGRTAVLTAGLIPSRRMLKTVDSETGEEVVTTGAPWDRDDIRNYDFNWPGYTPIALHLLAAASGRPTAVPLPELGATLARTPYDAIAAQEPTRLETEVLSIGWDESAHETRGVMRVTNAGDVVARLVRAGITGTSTMDCRVRDGFVDLMPGEHADLRFEIAGAAGDIDALFASAGNAPRVQASVPTAA